MLVPCNINEALSFDDRSEFDYLHPEHQPDSPNIFQSCDWIPIYISTTPFSQELSKDLRSRLAKYERIKASHQYESHGSHPTAGPTSNYRIRSKGYLKATVASKSQSAQPKDTDVSPRRTVTVARKRYAY